MKYLTFCSKVIFLITTILLCNSCGSTVVERRNIICLIDYSASVNEPFFEQVAEIIQDDIFLNLGEYDRFILLPIDQEARTKPTKIVDEDLRQQSFRLSTDGLMHANDSLNDRKQRYLSKRAHTITRAILDHRFKRKAFTHSTDIFSALHEVGRLLESTPINSRTELANYFVGKPTIRSKDILIIFSDMIHESREYSFARNYKKDYNQKVIADLKTTHQIPDLGNTTVLVHGRTGTSARQVEDLMWFWEKYFQLAHARLMAYEYDSRSLITQVLEQ